MPHRLRKQIPFMPHITEEYPQRDVILSELRTCVLKKMYLQCVYYHEVRETYTFSENLGVRVPEWSQIKESGKDACSAMMTEGYARMHFSVACGETSETFS